MTKEYIKFQVVLCSSNSFMHSWVSNFVGNDAIVIGHLSKEDAEMFWDTVASQGFRGQETLPFNAVYDICGGSMFLLHKMYQDYTIGGIHPTESFYLYQAHMKLMKSLEPNNTIYRDPLKCPPKWKKEHLLEITKKLVKSEGGYVYYDSL